MKSALFALNAFILGFLVMLAMATPEHIGDAFESLCIKGRISVEQAEAINAVSWRHTPTYCEDEAGIDKNGKPYIGQSDCRARQYDRILRAECSHFGKMAMRGD